jgi:hypothetical protein
VALALVGTLCSLIVAYEAIRYREYRLRIRHPETRGPPDPADMRSSPRASTEGRMVNEEFKKALEASREIELTVTGRHPAVRSLSRCGSRAIATSCTWCR